jgi:hypothetical protein
MAGASQGGSGATAGGNSTGGTTGSGTGGSTAGSSGTSAHPPATGAVGKWENVTSPDMDPSLFTGPSGFGVGNIVQDPQRPTDMYAGGYGSLWKSVDYGFTWTEVPSNPVPAYEPLGHVLAIGGDSKTTTLWLANGSGGQKVYRSTDLGLTFTLTGTLSGGPDAALYSIIVDPNDATHLLSGFHEQDGMAESTDGGDTWQYTGTSGWPSGGISWFPFFVATGDAAKTRKTWLAIAQNGGSVVMTSDSGATWSIPNGISGLGHAHGNASLYQNGSTLFISGTGGDAGDGVYRSTDLGQNWERVNMQAMGDCLGE